MIYHQLVNRFLLIGATIVSISFWLALAFSNFWAVFSEQQSPTAVTIRTAEGDNFFSPAAVTIQLGDTITFTNSGSTPTFPGFHNIAFKGTTPAGFEYHPPSSDNWTYAATFTEPGIYDFVCEPHEAQGMIGRITVETPIQDIYLPLIVR